MDLSGQRILVTGAGGHFGRAVSTAIEAAGGSVLGYSHEELNVMLPLVVEREIGRALNFDGVVHAAGVIGEVEPFVSSSFLNFPTIISVNLHGTVMILQQVLRRWIKERVSGSFVALGGGGGRALPQRAVYAATKAAVSRLVECVAAENEGSGIRINCLAPGPMPSKMQVAQAKAGLAVEGDATTKAVNCAIWLLSDECKLNGRTISARHDPWPHMPYKLTDDLFRLRRVSL